MSEPEKLLRRRYGFNVPIGEAINETIQSILSHQTCRDYKTDPISNDLLTLLLACAQSAPTKSNLQQYSIIVLRDPEIRLLVSRLVPSMEWLSVAPVIFVFLGDVRRIRRLTKKRGYKYQNNNADTFLNATVDAAVAMQALITGAESLGLGTCPVSYLRNRIEELSEILKLPEGVFPICGLALGYKAKPGVTSIRLPQEIVVHYNGYEDNHLEAKIAEFDDRVHDASPIAPEKQRHTEKYGVLEKCSWSENVSRQLSQPEREGFAKYLKLKKISLA